jgi:hypothetical protein
VKPPSGAGSKTAVNVSLNSARFIRAVSPHPAGDSSFETSSRVRRRNAH